MSKLTFKNIDPHIKPKGLLQVLKWKLNSKRVEWPQSIAIESYDIPPERVPAEEIRVSFVGHVTFLIQTQNVNILTDPVWSERTSPLTFAGPKRVTPPGIKFEDLPKIDLILVSHNHYDHMDLKTIRKICQRDNPLVITPLMNDVILKEKIKNINVQTLDWHEETKFNENFIIHLAPSQHWSARGLFDRNLALWGTFIVKTPKGSICFIGDSGYSKEIFQNIGNKFDDITLSLIPIGAFEPRWFMKDVHINPEEAVLIHQHLKSRHSIGSHFETFKLADDEFKQPAKELELARIKYNIADDVFITPKIGGVYHF